jgi:putative endonuclease
MKRGDQRKLLGEAGEVAAVRYLTGRGYRIIERNWRCRLGEIDAIAMHGSQLVFVEVRTRSTLRFGTGAESIDSRKQQKLRQLALAYLKEKRLSAEQAFRFDVVSVQRMPSGQFELDHIANAF